MAGNREAFKKVIVEGFSTIINGNNELRDKNIELFTNMVDRLSDDELDKLVDDIEAKRVVIPIIIPNGAKGVDYERNLDLIEQYGLGLHQKIVTIKNGVKTMSPIPRLILELPLKKPIQMLDKKRSIAKDTNTKNVMTGQVTGDSKAMSLSSEEITLMAANGMNDSIRELTKYRGGDLNAELLIGKLADMGVEITQEILERHSSGPEVVNTLYQYLLSMHIVPKIGELDE